MATLVQALVGGVLTLIDASTLASNVLTGTNGTTALTPGMYISTDNAGGNISPADAPTGKFSNGFVLAAFAAASATTYRTDGQNTAVTGYAPGKTVYLGTNGAGTTTPAEPAVGGGYQTLGQANTATNMAYSPDGGYTRA